MEQKFGTPRGTLSSTRFGKSMTFALPESGQVPFVLAPMLDGEFYEERFLRYIRSLNRGGQYIDVGAHLGTHTVWFAMQCKASHVYSFEPVARYANLLRATLALNGLTDRVTVNEFGLSDRDGMDSNMLAPSHQQGFVEEPQEVTETFAVHQLDDVVQGPVSVIKLDVEGMEPAVLRGATRILRDYSPVVFAEARDESERLAVATVLQDHGYLHTGRVFNSTPTYEFRKPSRYWDRLIWKLRSRSRMG